ncbi:hypothetical protein [Spirulina sp. 06S082]|uniref:hypothetical protein n=1 Tax=Spirulina sp. 06S082 TaxID=3110248 RepID=UPI002B1F5536|nr:hypothetical protein [Spirulina sp. 06S082]MEA5469350.1 hypothetical protein [Spirulina sp. 06S082]
MKPDPLTIGALAIVAIGGIANAFNGGQQTRSAQTTETQTAKVSMQIEEDAIAISKKLAETRYQSGLCLIANNPIAPGQIVRGAKTGQIVCDRFGNTAIVSKTGELLQLAKTDDKNIIQGGIN